MTRKGIPLPPSTLCGPKPTPHDCTAHPIHWGAAPSLPPIDEEDEVDDDDMEFSHEPDNYDFHDIPTSSDGKVWSGSSAFLVFDSSPSDILHLLVQPYSKVISSDAESYALHLDLLSALNLSSSMSHDALDFCTISNISIFTDSISSTKLLFDYSAHSAHQDAITIAPALSSWLSSSPSNSVTFWQIPSTAKWLLHHKAHTLAKSLKLPVLHNTPVCTSLAYY
ncbi:hypothetical protein P691DRAFT_767196 [Macrolepiota fuliginosa MF-IS2]|uniref:Uncharacterized protein n=1 Tax=Macrolepiota fuliginosa MF-IS2 TaxID=1400762 RepID=A0A9P5WYH6_9AGAR|nr:hypothetical protein P691DRAFT_767196 [Macrolepiota fuliginosa MF-IS2]